MREQVPKALALSREALGHCVYLLDTELFGEPEGRFLVNSAAALDLRNWTLDDFARMQGTLKHLRRVPWWLRKRWIEKHCDAGQKLAIARRLALGYEKAKAHPYVRVRTRRFALLARELCTRESLHDPMSDHIGQELVSAEAYCEWVGGGGCPDLGRYLGMYWSIRS
jgi:hypothetical protein